MIQERRAQESEFRIVFRSFHVDRLLEKRCVQESVYKYFIQIS